MGEGLLETLSVSQVIITIPKGHFLSLLAQKAADYHSQNQSLPP
jgi:hypothetical protein